MMLWFGREMTPDDRCFLSEVVILVVVALAIGFSGPYTTLVVTGLGLVYTLFILWILGRGGLEGFDRFTEGLFFRRLAIVLAAPGIAFWYML